MKPWEHALPPVLYKYLPPDRFHVLRDGRVRFSQRSVFEDDHELEPGYASFGTEDEIWKYVLSTGASFNSGGIPPNLVVKMLAEDPRKQQLAIQGLKRGITILDKIGIFCLTEASDSDRMWTEYAREATGFVIGFDTSHTGLEQLIGRGHLGKVQYSDEPIGSALGSLWNEEGVGALFRKRMKYAFEQEWRFVRMLHRLEQSADNVFLSPFDPASVREIIFRPDCAIETDLRQLAASDERYRHVEITSQK